MNFIELSNKRQSVRGYSNKSVERELILKSVEAARIAPSASNSQPWKFIVVDDVELKNKIARETFSTLVSFNKFALQAPVIIVITLEKVGAITQIGGRVKNREYALYDIGIAAEHFCLQAAEDGLGTCMIGWFNEKPIKELLNIPDKRSVSLVITLGYPENDKIRDKKRKTIEIMSSFNSY